MARRAPPATAVLVLGMHRSGTSAVTGGLRELGFQLGDELMAPAPDNPKGFWEHAGVVALHERLLHALDREWNDPRPLPAGWLDTRAAAQARADLEALLRKDFAGVDRWAVKDPRMSRLLPLRLGSLPDVEHWLPVLRSMGVAPRVLLVLRHPDEVAASLRARNDWPEGLSRLLWLQHVAEAESDSREVPRAVLHYEALLADPAGALRAALDAAGVPMDALSPDARKRLGAFVSAADRHHVAGEDADAGLAAQLCPARIPGSRLRALRRNSMRRAPCSPMRSTGWRRCRRVTRARSGAPTPRVTSRRPGPGPWTRNWVTCVHGTRWW